MANRSVTKSIKLLEWLRKNTDENHALTQDGIRKNAGEEFSKEVMGDKGTFARRLKELADGLNTDENDDVLPKDEQRIRYPGYGKNTDGSRCGKIHYAHRIADDEMDFLIGCIRASHEFTSEQKESFESRLKESLKSRYYQYPSAEFSGLVTEVSPAFVSDSAENKKGELNKEVHSINAEVDLGLIEKNISSLRNFIRKQKMILIEVKSSASGNGRWSKFEVSPYRIIHKDGNWWLIANRHERPGGTYEFYDVQEELYYNGKRLSPWYTDNLSAYRLDLIRDIEQAYVPDKTPVHTGIRRVRHFYIRESFKNSERKARNTEFIRMDLRWLDKNLEKIRFEHFEDIR